MAKLQSYALSVALTKMKHSIITAKSGQKCLVIPIDDNYLTLKDDAVYLQTDIVTMDSEDQNGNWGFAELFSRVLMYTVHANGLESCPLNWCAT